MDQLPRLGKRELICLLLFTCNYVVSVWRGFLFLWVLGMGYVILLWHSLSLPYNYFGTDIGYDKLYCVTKNQPQIAYQFMYLSIFLSLIQKFLSQISQLLVEPGSSNIVYTRRVAKYIV